ncbi:MAG: leucine--tRNA ligase [archaeon]|jgi:leucyl-tRNA synthetase
MSTYNFSEIEKKWQREWENQKIGVVEPDSSKEKYFIIWAYLTVSGFHHVGHMRGFSYADAIARYKRMQGFNVLLPAGGHASGNAAVAKAKKVSEKDKETIDYYKEAGLTDADLKTISTPEGFVDFFSKRYVEDYENFGFIGDWRRFTVTTNPDYNKFIEWQFMKLKELNLLVQAPYYATVCVNCGPVAVDPSEMDLSKGGKAEKNEYTIIKLEFEKPDQYIVVATLRPETMFGQTNVWLDYNEIYVKIQVGKETWIASKDFADKLKFQKDENAVILGQISGKEMVGKYCKAPYVNRDIIILPSKFCDPIVGTGIVTSVPSDAPADYIGLKDLQVSEEECKKYGLDWNKIKEIKPIAIIKSKDFGEFPAKEICERFGIKSQEDTEKLEFAKKEVYKKGFHTGVLLDSCGAFKGMKVEDAKNKMKEDLIAKNQADIFYDLSEEVLCRCGGKVVIKKVPDQWFIDYDNKELTEKTKKHVEKMTLLPDQFKQNLPGIIDWFGKRACARQGRWLGTKLPFDTSYTIEPIADSTLYPIYYLVSKYVNEGKIKTEQLIEKFFDYVYLGKGKAEETGIEKTLAEQVRKDIEYWYPLDINLGGKEHQTVHFPVFLMNHVGILPEKYYPQGIFVNWWVVSKSGKISKSKGGVRSLSDEAKTYSVDAMRLFYANVANPFVDISFEKEDLINYKQRIDKIYNLVEEILDTKENNKDTRLDSWLESQWNLRLKSITEAMDIIEFKAATDDIYFNFYNDLLWYRNRDGSNKELLKDILNQWTLTMGLFTPHLAEELNEKLDSKELVAKSRFPKLDEKKINTKILEEEKRVEKTISDLRNLLVITGIKKPNKISLFISENWAYYLFKELKEEIVTKENRNVKELMHQFLDKYNDHKEQVNKVITLAIKNPAVLEIPENQASEFSIYMFSRDFISKIFNCDVEIIKAGVGDTQKTKPAMPGKIGILIE